MKKMMSKLKNKVNQMVCKAKTTLVAMVGWVSFLPFRAKAAVANSRGEGFVDTAIIS